MTNNRRILHAFERASNRGFVSMLLAAGRTCLMKFYRMTGHRYVMRRVNGYQMFLDMQDPGLSRALMLFRTRELDMKAMLKQFVRPGMRIYDIGGNIGYYPLLDMELLCGSGELIVVEPVPDNVALLKRNLALNGYHSVPVLEAAISNAQGKKSLHLSGYSNLGTFHPNGSASKMLTGDTVEVETLTMSMLAERFGPPDLIRMDIEGHEVEVIDGMLDDIANGAYAPIMVFETHLDRYTANHDMVRILRKLFALGYCVPLVSSGSDTVSDRFIRLGYEAGSRIATDATYRTLFSDIRPDDAIDFICCSGGVRTVVLERTV